MSDSYRYYTNKKGDPLSVYIEDQNMETVLAFFAGDNTCRVLDRTHWNREKLWGVQAVTRAQAEFTFVYMQGGSEKPFPSVEKIGLMMAGNGLE